MSNYIEKEAKSLLRKGRYTDSWFICKYNMNLYRGCENACVYCDGRAEKYNVDGEFGKDISVKINALELLEKEIAKIKEKSIIALGGGVGDSYQKAENKYQLTKRVLELIYQYDFPVHILTKSNLIERDLDILKKINEKNGAIISFSFSSPDQKVVDVFEPGCASVEDKFRMLDDFKKAGFYTGIMLMPVIPFISDDEKSFINMLDKAKKVNVDFIVFSGMTLKTGRQKDHFYQCLSDNYPDLISKYDKIYTGDKWGSASGIYYSKINNLFHSTARNYKIPLRIPHYIYKNRVELNVEIALILFHIYYFLNIRGEDKKAYEKAAWSLMFLKEDVVELANKNELKKLSGVGDVIERLIKEVIETGKSTYYEKLLYLN